MLVILCECNKRNSVLSYGNKTYYDYYYVYYIVYYYKKKKLDLTTIQTFYSGMALRWYYGAGISRRFEESFLFFYSRCRYARVRFSVIRDHMRRLFSGRRRRRFENITVFLLPSYAY